MKYNHAGWFVFPWRRMMLDIFSYACWLLLCFPWRNVYSNPLPIFIFYFYFATPMAYGSSQARDQIWATQLRPSPQLWQHWILNPQTRPATEAMLDPITSSGLRNSPLPIFNWVVCLCVRVLCIFWTLKPLSDRQFADIFSHFIAVFLHSGQCSSMYKSFQIWWGQKFFFVACAFAVIFKNPLPIQGHENLPHVFFWKCYSVTSYILVVHPFELVCVYGVR